MKIATLGPKGTYSEQAAIIFANRLAVPLTSETLILTTVNQSLRLVQNREVDYALIPAENTIDGLIGSSFDALIEYQDFVKVCDEVNLPISHVLAARPGVEWAKIRTVYSHPSALNQCQNRLEELFPGIALIPVLSTSEAAQKAISSEDSAAICSRKTASAKQMNLFPENIQDYPNNETRFFVCSLTDGAPSQDDRTLLAVRYGMNQPGQLYDTARYLADAGIDLTFVQSRPYKIRPQEYVIIYEFMGHKSSPEIDAALKNIELQVRASNGWKKILGSYPKRKREAEVEFIK